jgi:hypothetical protein
MAVELFCRRQPEPVMGLTLLSILSKFLKPTKGAVGIEVEVEGNKFPKVPGYETTHKALPLEGWTFWSYVKDGSLRGHDNAEYVLQKPIEFEQVPDAIAELDERLKAYGSVMAESNRTSVHVHLNCQDFYMNRLAAFCALYFCFEEVLVEWCGEHRVGNLFCLRGKDAPGIITKIKRFIQSDGQSELSDGLHYSGLNANALTKFGSLEVRSMRGPTDLSVVVQWVKILERLYKLSADFTDPRDIPAQFSAQGPLTFFETMLGEEGFVLRQGIAFDDERIRDSMYEGIRLAQDLCYCRDWGNFKPVNLKDDPFGRDMRKVAKAVAFHEAYGGISAPSSLFQLQAFASEYIASAPSPASPFSLNTLQPMVSPAPVEFEEPEEPEEFYEPDFD